MNLEVIILAIIVLTVCQTKQTSVSDLYDIMHDIHSDVIHSSTELYYRLDEYSTYISHASHETHESFIKELNINVDYYTYYITKIEEEASAGNLDISSCIHSANSHINALNENLMSSLRGLDELETGAQSLMEKAYLEIYTEPKFKLDNMWSEVEQCLNDDCATELQRELMKQHQNMTQVMNESYTNVVNFILEIFEGSLRDYSFDRSAYLSEVYFLLNQIYECTNQLVISLTGSDSNTDDNNNNKI